MSTNDKQKILIADDDERYRQIFKEVSLSIGLVPVTARDGLEALHHIKKQLFALALVDLKMPKMGGIDFLIQSRQIVPGLPVIIVTGFGTIESAVEAMKLGAIEYITKPSSLEEVKRTVKQILDSWNSSWRNMPPEGEEGKFNIVGRSKTMQLVYERIEAMCQTDNTVLVMGESGVGKELVAKAIHYCGYRAKEPFIPIDCSVLGLNIVESELFGHSKGAFTDAHYDKVGLLQLAGKGTVFLDEITGIPLPVQAKLLRAIQEREIRSVGATKIEKIEARIIAATNRPLEQAVREGKFREDLFYRLHVIPISVPPLRERRDDIPFLAHHFIKKYNTERRSVQGIAPETMGILSTYHWPGNVRELENVIQEAIALGSSEWIRTIDLPQQIRHSEPRLRAASSGVKPLKEIEKETIVEALRISSGNKIEAARILGIGKSTLYEKIKKYSLEST
jgi:two-component system response regulator HydG